MSEVKSKNNQQKEYSPSSKYPELNDSELEIVCGGKGEEKEPEPCYWWLDEDCN